MLAWVCAEMRTASIGGKAGMKNDVQTLAEKQPRRQHRDEAVVAYPEAKRPRVETQGDGTKREPPNQPQSPPSVCQETPCYEGLLHDPVDNHERGDVSCRTCGLVLDEKTTVADVEWAKNKTGVDLPAQLERHGDFSFFSNKPGSLETTLDFSNCQNESNKTVKGHQTNNNANKLVDSTGYLLIRDLFDRLGVNDDKTRDEARAMLQQCYEKKMFNNEKSMLRFVPVCVYIACLDSIPVFKWEVLSYSEFHDEQSDEIPKRATREQRKSLEQRMKLKAAEEKEKKFADTYRQIQKELFNNVTKRGEIERGDYVKSLARIVPKLGLKPGTLFKIEHEAKHLLQTIRDLGRQIITCMNDDLLAPAAIYAAACAHGDLAAGELAALKTKLCRLFVVSLQSLERTYEMDIYHYIDKLITDKRLIGKLPKPKSVTLK